MGSPARSLVVLFGHGLSSEHDTVITEQIERRRRPSSNGGAAEEKEEAMDGRLVSGQCAASDAEMGFVCSSSTSGLHAAAAGCLVI